MSTRAGLPEAHHPPHIRFVRRDHALYPVNKRRFSRYPVSQRQEVLAGLLVGTLVSVALVGSILAGMRGTIRDYDENGDRVRRASSVAEFFGFGR